MAGEQKSEKPIIYETNMEAADINKEIPAFAKYKEEQPERYQFLAENYPAICDYLETSSPAAGVVKAVDLANIPELNEMERRFKAKENLPERKLKTLEEYKAERPHMHETISEHYGGFVRLLESSPPAAIEADIFDMLYSTARDASLKADPFSIIIDIHRDSKRVIHGNHSSECYQRFPSPWLSQQYLVDA